MGIGTPGQIRTDTVRILSPLSLPVGLREHGTPPRIRTETEPLLRRLSLPVGIEERGTQGEIRTHKLPLLRRHCLPLHHLRILVGREGIAPPLFQCI